MKENKAWHEVAEEVDIRYEVALSSGEYVRLRQFICFANLPTKVVALSVMCK